MTRKILLLGKKGRLSSVMLRMKQQSSGPIIKNGEEGCERFLLSPYLSRALPFPGTNMIYYYQVSLSPQKRNFPCHILRLDLYFLISLSCLSQAPMINNAVLHTLLH